MTTIDELNHVFSNYYALYLKTQSYHWHVTGPHFKNLHEQFQEQYEDLATSVDVLAERIVTLGGKAPGTFNAIMQYSEIKDGDVYKKAEDMVLDLISDHELVVKSLKRLEEIAGSEKDSVTEDLAISRTEIHQKYIWMLSAFLEN